MTLQYRLFPGLFPVLLFSICGFYSCSKKDPDTKIYSKDSLYIFIMAGQSNMAGRGVLSPDDTLTNPRIYTIDSLKNLVLAKEPLHFYQPGFSGLDCGKSFAEHLLPFIPAGARICLVPCAISSTTVQDWLGDSSRGPFIYSNLLDRTRIAMKYGVLKGILWHQGEANAESASRATGYGDTLRLLILKLRTDLQSIDLPFYAATLAPFCARPYRDSINAQIYHDGAAMKNVFVIPTDGLTGKSDSIHFDAAGQRGLGARFAAKAQEEL